MDDHSGVRDVVYRCWCCDDDDDVIIIASSTSLDNTAKHHLQIWVPVLSRYWQVPLSNIVIYPSVAV